MRLPSGPTLVLLVVGAVLAVLAWKVVGEPLFAGGPAIPAPQTATQVRAACLDALGRDLGTAVQGTDASLPAWNGQRWAWTSAVRVDGDALRFACARSPGGSAVVRVLN